MTAVLVCGGVARWEGVVLYGGRGVVAGGACTPGMRRAAPSVARSPPGVYALDKTEGDILCCWGG